MLLALLILALQGTALLVLFATLCLAYYMLHDPAVRRAAAIAEASSVQPENRLPILGHLLRVLRPTDELFSTQRELRKQLGSRFSLSLLGRTSYFLSDPEAVEVVLSSSKNISKGGIYDFLHPWLGQGLLTSGGQLWRSRRKLLTPAFHFRILDQFAGHLEKQAAGLVAELDKASRAAGSEAVDVVPAISRATLRSIRVTAMGNVEFQSDSASGSSTSEKSYFDAVHSVGLATVYRSVRPWLWAPIAFTLSAVGQKFRKDLATLHNYTERVIAARKQKLFSSDASEDDDVDDGKRRRPFLDVLLSAQRSGADLSDLAIREEVDTFMFEGHDTTSMALSWALEMLGRHPDEQALLAEELADAGSDWDSVGKLPYLDRVLKECLRLRPSVPLISRALDSDATTPDGQILPATAEVNVVIYDLHRDPNHWPEPERFDPDRFLPELEQQRHPFAYVPFSAGPRNCIGKRFALMEVKLMLAALVRHFDIRSAMSEEVDAIADLVLRPRDGVRLYLAPRSSGSPEKVL